MRLTRWSTAAAVAAVLVALSGCHSGAVVACPAIGHITVLDVVLEGNAAAVASVIVCSDAGCSPKAPFEPFTSVPHQVDHRSFVVSGDPLPVRVTVRATSTSGRVLASRSAELTWSRNKPGDVCDLSVGTPPLKLEVGA